MRHPKGLLALIAQYGIVVTWHMIDIQYYMLFGELEGVIDKSSSICNEFNFQEKLTSNICMDY